MSKVIKSASVHHRTVTKLSMNQISTPKRSRKPRLKDRRRHEVKTTSFAQITNKEVRAAVIAISGKDIRRVQIIGPEEAIVYNHRNWRKR